MMKPGNAHPEPVRQLFNAQWLVDVLTEVFDCLGDIRGITSLDGQVTELVPLLTEQQAVNNFSP